jgi:hypothetical protein
MTKLLEEAFEAVRRLTPHEQDEIARAIFQLAVSDHRAGPIPLSPEERDAIARSKAAAARVNLPRTTRCKQSGLSTRERLRHTSPARAERVLQHVGGSAERHHFR